MHKQLNVIPVIKKRIKEIKRCKKMGLMVRFRGRISKPSLVTSKFGCSVFCVFSHRLAKSSILTELSMPLSMFEIVQYIIRDESCKSH